MSKTRKAVSDFNELRGGLHAAWHRHRQQLLEIPSSEAWPGAAGLAMLLDKDADIVEPGGSTVLVPSSRLKVMTMLAIPPRRFADVGRWVRLSVVAAPRQVDGAVVLGGAMAKAELSFDDVSCPYHLKKIKTVGARITVEAGSLQDLLTLNSQRQQEFRTANLIREGLIGFAAARRDGDRPHTAPPHMWLPEPYVTVPEALTGQELLEHSIDDGFIARSLVEEFLIDVRRGLPVRSPVAGVFQGYVLAPPDQPYCSDISWIGVKDAKEMIHRLPVLNSTELHVLRDQPVQQGAELGLAVSRERPMTPTRSVWADFASLERMPGFNTPTRMRFQISSWLDRQRIRLPDGSSVLPYGPLAYVATGPLRGQLPLSFFRVDRLEVDLFDPEAEAWVFPPLPLRAWDDLEHQLPHQMRLTLDPGDARLDRRRRKNK